MPVSDNKSIDWVFDRILIAVFCIILLLPGVRLILGSDQGNDVRENRALAQLPAVEWTPRGLAKYLVGVRSYINDHFPFRTNLIEWHAWVNVEWLGKSPTDRVVFGREGWLYLHKHANGYQYHVSLPFNQEELEAWRLRLEDWNSRLAREKIKLLVMFAPNKSSIYPEYLPDWYPRGKHPSRLDQLMAYMEEVSDVPMLNLKRTLLLHKERQPETFLYEKTGTHWNELGAFVAYRAIAEKLKEWYPRLIIPTLEDFIIHSSRGRGDLAWMLGMRTPPDEMLPRLERRRTCSSRIELPRIGLNESDELRHPFATVCQEGDLPKAVMFRDSFAERIHKHLSENFGRILYIWDPVFDLDVVEREKPDVVIYELVERGLSYPIPGMKEAGVPQYNSDIRKGPRI